MSERHYAVELFGDEVMTWRLLTWSRTGVETPVAEGCVCGENPREEAIEAAKMAKNVHSIERAEHAARYERIILA